MDGARGLPTTDRPHAASAGGEREERAASLGSLAFFFLLTEGATGIALLFFYRPVPALAYVDLVDMEAAGLGALRQLHRWGSHALVAVVVLHLLSVLLRGGHRAPFRRDWQHGVVLGALVVLAAATGSVLPRDAGARGVVAALGTGLSAPGLLAVYALHVTALPAALGLLGVHHQRRTRAARRGSARG